MGILSLIILNAWRKFTAPRNLRVIIMAAVILLEVTQILMLLAVIPGLGKIPVSLRVSVKELLDPAGRGPVDIWLILVNTLALATLRFKLLTLAAGVLFALMGTIITGSFGDRVITEKRLAFVFVAVLLLGAVFGLALFELGPYLILAVSATAAKSLV